MALLELISPSPDWTTALSRALQRPPGVPERRASREARPGAGSGAGGGRRLADDLAWLREALDDPHEHGLQHLPDTAAVAVWEADLEGDRAGRLFRLRDRGILDAAGFLLHDPDSET